MTKQQYRWITTTVRSAAVRAVQELRHQPHTSLSGACRQVANQLDVHPNTVKNWWHAAVLADPSIDDTRLLGGALGDLDAAVKQVQAFKQLNAELIDALDENRSG